jgi:hypothetical protein
MLSGRMIVSNELEKSIAESGQGVILGTVLEFSWRDWGERQKPQSGSLVCGTGLKRWTS